MAAHEAQEGIRLLCGSEVGEVFGGFGGLGRGEPTRADEVVDHEMGLLLESNGGGGGGREVAVEDDTQLRRIISCRPKLVTYDVDKTLAPKFHSLQSLGFTASDLTSLIASDPSLRNSRVDSALLQRIRFWESLLGSRDSLFKVLKLPDVSLLSGRVGESALPNLSLLRSCGVSEGQIGSMLRKNPRIILRKPEDVSALVEQVEQMGIPKSSGMFIWGFYALNLVSKARLNANLELMKSFGWSKADFLSVFCRTLNFTMLPRKSLSNKMNFLVKEVGMDPLAVASAPMLLLHSLERRLIPRHHIIWILESRKLLDRKYKLITVVGFPDKVFVEKCVTPYKDKVPELEEIEIA